MSQADRARARLVTDLLRDGRVRSPSVRDALESVPRHLFLPELTPAQAYADEAVAIKVQDGVTISSVSQPSMVAIMLEQLAARPGHRVLEIGAGAGWNAGLLARIVGPSGAVTTVDIDDDLVRDARRNLETAGVPGVRAVTADGAAGHPPDAPYDRIELTVGSTDIRPEWVAQLVPGGRLLLPLAVRGSQLSVAFALTAPGRLDSVSVRSCAFIRLRGAGAGTDPPVRPLGCRGWAVQVAESGGPDPEVVARALAGPGAVADPSPEAGTVTDIWDGLGLWCALADPAVFRLMAVEPPAAESETGQAMFEAGSTRVAVGVAAGDGFALLMAAPRGSVRTFGRAGGVAAARLAGLVRGWVAAGRPHAADLRIRAEMLGSTAPGPGPTGAPTGPGSTVSGPAVAESAVAEPAVPESAHAESAVPGSGVPGSGVPESEVPESGVPESGVPESAVAESGVSGSAERESVVPQPAAPGSRENEQTMAPRPADPPPTSARPAGVVVRTGHARLVLSWPSTGEAGGTRQARGSSSTRGISRSVRRW